MEREMKSNDETNLHMREERGMSVTGDEEELYSRVHTSERPRRRGHPAPPREEKVLSRSIMQKVPPTESPKAPLAPVAPVAPVTPVAPLTPLTPATPATSGETRKSEEGEKKSGVERGM